MEQQKPVVSFTDELKEGAIGRLKHPVFGTLGISYLLCNWEFIYTLIIGGEDAAKVIDIALGNVRWYLLVLPLFITPAYLYLSLRLSNFYNWYVRRIEKEKIEQIVYEQENEMPVPSKLYREAIKQRNVILKEFRERHNEIALIREQMNINAQRFGTQIQQISDVLNKMGGVINTFQGEMPLKSEFFNMHFIKALFNRRKQEREGQA